MQRLSLMRILSYSSTTAGITIDASALDTGTVAADERLHFDGDAFCN